MSFSHLEQNLKRKSVSQRIYALKNPISHEKLFRSISRISVYHQKDTKSPKGTQAYQKADLFRRLEQKGNLQNVGLSEEDLNQKTCPARFIDTFERSNVTRQRSKRNADTLKS